MNIPSTVHAGDTISWNESLADYPASSYNLAFDLRSYDCPPITITASANGNDHAISCNAATTKGWKAGIYAWQAYAYTGSPPDFTTKVTLQRGTIEIRPDLTGFSATGDPRSHVKKVLDALEAVIEGKATSDQLSYSIAGRSISKMSPTEILQWRDLYKTEYQREMDAEKISQGIESPRRIGVRFRRV
jgi:hypothetical protein